MKYIWIFFPAIFWGSISGDLQVALRSLQQIRTLIPERLIDEEFSILVDRKAFAKAYQEMRESNISSMKTIYPPHFYYTHWTVSGEPIRILDFYQEFEYGPYWLYPTAMQDLYFLHHPAQREETE